MGVYIGSASGSWTEMVTEVGPLDYGQVDGPPERNLMTFRATQTMRMVQREVDPATLALLVGMDPAKGQEPSDVAIAVRYQRPPFTAPVKRRGLTGKRYRIARRRYARQRKAYARGLIRGTEVVITMPRASAAMLAHNRAEFMAEAYDLERRITGRA